MRRSKIDIAIAFPESAKGDINITDLVYRTNTNLKGDQISQSTAEARSGGEQMGKYTTTDEGKVFLDGAKDLMSQSGRGSDELRRHNA